MLYIHSPTYDSCCTWDSNLQPLGYESNYLTIRPQLPLKGRVQILIISHVSLCSLHKGRLNVFTTLLQKQLSQCHAALHMYSKQSREFGTAARSHSQSTWLNRCSDGKQPLCCSNYLTSVWAVKCADSAGGWRVCKHLGIMDVDAQNESWKLRRKTRRGFWCRICAAINWRRMWLRAQKEDSL